MLRKLVTQYRNEAKLPEVTGERCVHAHIETAGCRACVEVCPHGAWIIDDESLGIDADACDGCGLCAPVCPEEAIRDHHSPAIRQRGRRLVAAGACEFADASAPIGILPCLHALGLRDLLRLYRRRIDHLLISSGDCDVCPRGKAVRLWDRVAELNSLLAGRGLPEMVVEPVPASTWHESAGSLSKPSVDGPLTSRRNFFRMRSTPSSGAGDAQLRRRGIPPGQILPRSDTADPVLFAPRLDPDRCNGCDACARICPHGAITIDESGDEAESAYRLDAELCSGCGICVDICDQAAVKVECWQSQGQFVVELHTATCARCRVPYRVPRAQSRTDGLCRICAAGREVIRDRVQISVDSS